MAKSHKKKSRVKPHKAFLVPELLEMILLQIDTRTLLVSGQRVCRLWHEVIRNSSNLQAALFFQPIKQSSATSGMKHIQNTLLAEKLWPEFLHSNIQSAWDKWPDKWSKSLPTMKRKREEAYIRPQASWRRMLLHQPPQFHFACFGLEGTSLPVRIPEFKTIIIPEEDRLVRTEDIVRVIQSGLLIPCQAPWTFAMTKSCESSPDLAKLDEIWTTQLSSLSTLLSQCSISGFNWPSEFDREISEN